MNMDLRCKRRDLQQCISLCTHVRSLKPFLLQCIYNSLQFPQNSDACNLYTTYLLDVTSSKVDLRCRLCVSNIAIRYTRQLMITVQKQQIQNMTSESSQDYVSKFISTLCLWVATMSTQRQGNYVQEKLSPIPTGKRLQAASVQSLEVAQHVFTFQCVFPSIPRYGDYILSKRNRAHVREIACLSRWGIKLLQHTYAPLPVSPPRCENYLLHEETKPVRSVWLSRRYRDLFFGDVYSVWITVKKSQLTQCHPGPL